MLATVVLVVVVVAFAWNLGVHYTGAVMGMPYAARVITLVPALVLIAVLVILGATFASGGVETTVGQNIIDDRLVTVPDAIVIVLAAGLLTLIYNARKVPTSTIQILVFCVVGTGLAGRIPIHWGTIARLAIVWVLAPPIACALGFVFTRLLDRVIPPEAARIATEVEARRAGTATLTGSTASIASMSGEDAAANVEGAIGTRGGLTRLVPALALAVPSPPAYSTQAPALSQRARLGLRYLPLLLLVVGMAASFVLGANDVSNATGAFILTHQFPLTVAGLIGGVAMAVGALTWGRRILRTVAFDLVTLDLTMASAAQGVQALVVLAAVSQGLFTSMNQALIGAMAGTGLARGRETVHRKQLLGVVRGWLIGPLSGMALAAALEILRRLLLP